MHSWHLRKILLFNTGSNAAAFTKADNISTALQYKVFALAISTMFSISTWMIDNTLETPVSTKITHVFKYMIKVVQTPFVFLLLHTLCNTIFVLFMSSLTMSTWCNTQTYTVQHQKTLYISIHVSDVNTSTQQIKNTRSVSSIS